MSPVLDMRGVRFCRGGGDGFVLDVAALCIEPGAVVALVGPSGSGKTTILRLASGEISPDHGEVRVLGEPYSGMTPTRIRRTRLERIGIVAQTLSLVDYLTGLENIVLVAALLGQTSGMRERARGLAQRLEVGHVLGRRPRRMSQGERQRIAICRAMLLRPPVLLCDEPTGNLDQQRGLLALEMMREAASEDGTAVVLATHDEAMLDRCDRVESVAGLGVAAGVRG